MNIKPIKGTMKIHSVVAASPGIVRTRETTCVCDNCFKENGFVENSQCLWLEQNLTKPIREIQNSERQVNIEDKDADQETTVQVIESPKPTGRTQRIFSVNENILAYMLEIK
jgi:enoyl reductase-like protein